MSGVRVLVGTRKGAFILTSDDKREQWHVDGPHFGGWEIYHLKGSPVDPNRIYASQASDWFGQVITVPTTAARRGQRWATSSPTPARRARTSGTTARPSVGVQARLASGAVADRPRYYLRRGRGRGALSARPTAARPGKSCPGCANTTQAASGSRARAGCACTPLSSTRPTPTASSSPSRPPARSAPTTAARRGSRSTRGCAPTTSPTARRGGPLRPPRGHAPVAAGRAVHAKALGRDAQRRRRRQLARSQRQSAQRLRLRHRRARPRAGDDLRRAHQERLGALPAGGQAARLSQPQRRQRLGSADQRPAPGELLRQRPARRHERGHGSTRAASTSARPAARSTPVPTAATLDGHRPRSAGRCCRSRCKRCRDPRHHSPPPAQPGRDGRGSGGRGRRAGHAASGSRRAGGALPGVARHHPRPRHPGSGGRSCASSPAWKICPTNRPTRPCPRPWPKGARRFASSARLPAGKKSTGFTD
jgi:hypothetical protein